MSSEEKEIPNKEGGSRAEKSKIDHEVKRTSVLPDDNVSLHSRLPNPCKQLDFAAIHYCAIRQTELQTLLGEARETTRTKPALWIQAEAGVGKSWLLQRFQEELLHNQQQQQVLIIRGKFEERAAASEPFAALREALAELVEYSKNHLNPLERQAWVTGLRGVLESDIELLLSITPVLKPLLVDLQDGASLQEQSKEQESKDGKDDEAEDPFGDYNTKEYRFVRFRLAFRAIFRFVCARLQPLSQSLVLILDDFHWVDPDSLQIVKTLMEDPRKPNNLLLVAATRPLEGYAHLLDLQKSLTSTSVTQPSKVNGNNTVSNYNDTKIQVMELPRLTASEIALILKVLLEGRDDVTELAEIVKAKTQGNCFVVMQFLRLLERSSHIYFSVQSERWKFKISQIAQVDKISDNVSKVVAQNIQTGDRRRRSALMVASSLGVSRFDIATIVHAVAVVDQQQNESKNENSNSEFEEYEDPYVVRQREKDMIRELIAAAREGYVEETSPGHFRFAHDRIRESAYSLLPEGNSRKEVHLKVGRQLRSWMDTQCELGLSQSGFSKDSLLLHATRQLNAGADLIEDEWELLDLIDLNFLAAEFAARKTAFFSSMEYLQVGLDRLGGAKAWEKDYDRALRFYSALSRMQFCCGLLDECWETSECVVRHAKSFLDKSRIYRKKVLCLMQKEFMEEALKVLFKVFEIMKEPMPQRFVLFHVFREYMKASKFLKRSSDEDLLNLPPCYDERLERLLDFQQLLAETAFLTGKFGYVMLVAFQYLSLVAKNGNYPRSFFAYQLYACFFKPQMGDFAGSLHYGTLANLLSERQRESLPGFAARSEAMFLGYVRGWQAAPLRDAIVPAFDAFNRLWASGMIDTALLDASVLLQLLFAAGVPLERIIQECDKYSEAFIDYQQMGHFYINLSQFQAMRNFQGLADNPAVLSGDAMNAEDCLQTWKQTPNLPAIYNFQFWSMVVGYYFGDLENAKRNIKAMRKDLFEDGSCHLVPLRPFYTGLVYLALFRQTRKAKYRRRALRSLKLLQGWANKGSLNFVHMCQLLEAEDMSLSQKHDIETTVESYGRSIQSAARLELRHHQALANELAAAYLYSQQQMNRALPYVQASLALYSSWGAQAKVQDINSRYKEALT